MLDQRCASIWTGVAAVAPKKLSAPVKLTWNSPPSPRVPTSAKRRRSREGDASRQPASLSASAAT
jgi:hypothetical protein